MNSKIYKKGKLTKEAEAKLRSRLQKENAKPKTNARDIRKSKAVSKKTTPLTTKRVTETNESIVVTAAKVEPRTKAQKVMKKASELTMDDVEETLPPQKLVKERQNAMDQNNDVNWISLIGYNQKEAENEEKVYKKLERASNNKFRRDLDEQIAIKREQEQSKQQEVTQYQLELNTQFKKYKTDDLQKENKKHSNMLKLKEIRSTQVEELNHRRKYEELKLRKHDLKEVNKLKKALIKEAKDNKAKKENNINILKQMLVDNEAQKAIKEEERKKEEADAIRLQKEYAKMLEQQEKRREQQLNAIQEKQKQKFQALINATADIREKAEEDAKKAELELKRRQIVQDKKDKAKKDKLKSEMDACKVAIDAQIKDKMNKIKTDILEDKEYGKKMVKLHANYLQEIEDKKADKKRKQQEQSLYLEQQIAESEQKKREQKTEMSETEKLLNKQLLDEVRNIKLSPNNNEEPEVELETNPKAPFQWRYAYRKAPF